jgi:hypothetical protein
MGQPSRSALEGQRLLLQGVMLMPCPVFQELRLMDDSTTPDILAGTW